MTLRPKHLSVMCLIANYKAFYFINTEFEVAHGLHGNVNGMKHKVGGVAGSTAMFV